jgi:hypothetical protein
VYTANPNPVELTENPRIPTGKTLYSLQGTPVFIEGSLFLLQGFPCISLYFPVRDCSADLITYISVSRDCMPFKRPMICQNDASKDMTKQFHEF